MKRYFLLIAALFVCVAAFADDTKVLNDIVVVNKAGNVVGRYVGETADKYSISVQDTTQVAKTGLHVELYSAEKGQGIVYLTAEGVVNVREKPTTESKVVAKIQNEEGMVPETYECLGFEKGWFKIKVDGKVGYVRMDLMAWDSMDTF